MTDNLQDPWTRLPVCFWADAADFHQARLLATLRGISLAELARQGLQQVLDEGQADLEAFCRNPKSAAGRRPLEAPPIPARINGRSMENLKPVDMEEASRLLGWPKQTIWRFCRKGDIPGALKVGSRWYISRPALLAMLEAGEKPEG